MRERGQSFGAENMRGLLGKLHFVMSHREDDSLCC